MNNLIIRLPIKPRLLESPLNQNSPQRPPLKANKRGQNRETNKISFFNNSANRERERENKQDESRKRGESEIELTRPYYRKLHCKKC